MKTAKELTDEELIELALLEYNEFDNVSPETGRELSKRPLMWERLQKEINPHLTTMRS